MVSRELQLPDRSFFLFGPRQTGKSTWITSLGIDNSWYINFLHNETYYQYLRDPGQFRREAQAQIKRGARWIILDEVQRIPALLNEVHALLESTDIRFVLSGSSARKLKRGGANMLGGRAVVRRMHPFTVQELGDQFDLERALLFGTLPALHGLDQADARDLLRAYVEVYLREEIQMEGIVRNIGGYTRFLDLAASYAGETLNVTSVASDAGLAVRTVRSYFQVLEDTLIAIRLPAWRKSPRKRLVAHPRFYLFDNGVTNALTHRVHGPLEPSVRGRMFEQFMVLETQRRIDYDRADARLFFWRTNTGSEVDLLIEVQGRLAMAVEFKARPNVTTADLSGLRSFRSDHPDVPCYLVCTAPEQFTLDFAEVLPWRAYLTHLQSVLGW